MTDKYYVYILECKDRTLYTGITKDLEGRLKCHNEGKASKYTRVRLPVKYVYVEEVDERGPAQSREYAIRNLKREEKYNLIKKFSSSPLLGLINI